jgi:hypothetical protein
MMWGEGWGWGFGMLWMIGLWVVVIAGVVLVVKWILGASDRPAPKTGIEEFERKDRDLEG